MRYEVDLLPVSGGGAALCVRWGSEGRFKVLVYDGGSEASGEQLVRHIRTQYMTQTVDYVVNSHPVADHAAGLLTVLGALDVKQLWMHRPWRHGAALTEDLDVAHALEQSALARGIPISEPFQGARIGAFTVLSPGERWFVDSLLPAYGAPAPAPHGSHWLNRRGADAWNRLRDAVARARGQERLPSLADFCPKGESSAILHASFDGRGVLLTGCAGQGALRSAIDCAERMGVPLAGRLRLLQLPNLGNAAHLSSELLDRLVGAPMKRMSDDYITTAVSGTELGTRIGGRTLMQALRRRGAASFFHGGNYLHHGHDMPLRGWRFARPMDSTY